MPLSNTVYDRAKWVGLIVLPAVATLLIGVGQLWDIPIMAPIAGTVTLVSTAVGTIIRASTTAHDARHAAETTEEN